MRNKPDFERALPFVEAAFPTYHEFASATLADIVGNQALDGALVLTANTVDSVVLRNDGTGHFTIEPLPALVQAAPGFGIAMTDFNGDGFTDVYIAQNSFSPRREIGRWDGGVGVLCAGQRDGQLSVVHFRDSGLIVPGDAKSAVITDLNDDHWPDVVVGVNNANVAAFENRRASDRRMVAVRLRGQPGNPTGVGSRVTVVRSDGLRQTAEVQAGGGYLSQQSATLWFGFGSQAQVAEVLVRWSNGQTTLYTPPAGVTTITVHQPGAPVGQ
jgi:hypothetical protein